MPKSTPYACKAAAHHAAAQVVGGQQRVNDVEAAHNEATATGVCLAAGHLGPEP